MSRFMKTSFIAVILILALASGVPGFIASGDQLVHIKATPTYVDGSTFTVPGDFTAKLAANKVVLLDLVADGLKFNTVASSGFGKGVTTINLTSANLTVNLARVAVFATGNGFRSWGDGHLTSRDYGKPGQATLQAVIDFAAGLEREIALFPGVWTFTTDFIVAANIHLKPVRGVVLTRNGGSHLYINGPFECGLWQCFNDNSTNKDWVIFGARTVTTAWSEWWGGKSDGATDNRNAIQASLNSLADGMTLRFSPGNWRVTYGSVQVDHTASGGVASTYTALAKMVNKNNVKIVMDGVFSETADPVQIYQLIVLQNVRNSSFQVNFAGHFVLKEAMTDANNPLENYGCEGLYFTDNCFNNTFDLNFKSARSPIYLVRAAKAGAVFNVNNRPRGFHGRVVAEDCCYPLRSSADDVMADVVGINCKRVFRLDNGRNIIGRINSRVRDKWSWAEYAGHVYLNGSSADGIENVSLDIVAKDVPANILHLETRLSEATTIRNVTATVNIMGKGRIFVGADGNTGKSAQIIDGVTIKGNIVTDNNRPFYFQVAGGPKGSRSANIFRNFNLSDLNITCTAATILYPFDFSNSSISGAKYQDFSFNNINITSSSDGTVSSNFVKGCFKLRDHVRPRLANIRNNVTGLAAGDPLFGFINCTDIIMEVPEPRTAFWHTGTTCTKCEFPIIKDNTDVSTFGTGEDTLKSTHLIARVLGRDGGIRVKATGTKTGSAGNKTIKFYFGAHSFVIHPAANDTNDWRFEAEIYTIDSNANRMKWLCMSGNNIVGQGYEAFNEDITMNITVKLTGKCANVGDYITQTMWRIDRIN